MPSLSKLIGGNASSGAALVKRERRKQDRPGELLEAALELFVEKGFAATRAEEVAARAGVSKGTLFLYFASKEELFKAVVRENISGRFLEWQQEFQRFEGSAADMVRYCLKAWWQRIGDTRASGIAKLMMSESQNFPELAAFYRQEVMQPGQELIARVLRRGMERGEFRAIDVDYTALCLMAPMLFLVMMKHSLCACLPADFQLDPERFLAVQTDTLLHGLCRPAAEGAAA